tara:strand:- start:226 stop:1437 length:1212 start_codon:yes stop_codon:yes gene_type:complete
MVSKLPKLRFKEFTMGWTQSKLGELGQTISGLTYSPVNVVDKGLLVLRSSNIKDNSITYDDNVYVDLEVSEENLSKEDDILICVRNGSRALIGKSALIPKGIKYATHGAFMSVLRTKHPHFIFQLLQTRQFRKLVHRDLGATINSINGKNLLKYKFFLPKDTKEIEKISNFLTSVDQKISLLKEKRDLLTQYKKGVMQKLFKQEIRFKDDSGNEFPDWKFRKFSEVLSLSINPINMGDNEQYELITVRRRNGGVVSRGHYKGSEVLVKTQFRLSANQFVISKRQIVHGACGIVPATLDGAIVSNEYNVFDVNTDSLDVNFFNYYSMTKEMKRAYYINSDGVHIEKLLFKTQSWLKTLMPFPCVEEQKKIVSFIEILSSKISLLENQIELTEKFKKGLLQKMFV